MTQETEGLVEAVARQVCAHSVGGFCQNVGGHLGCTVGRGVAPDYRLCKASRDMLLLSGNLETARAIIPIVAAHFADVAREEQIKPSTGPTESSLGYNMACRDIATAIEEVGRHG